MITKPTGWIAHCENCWKELSSNEIDECWPQDEDEFIKDLKNQGWVVDEEGEVYCCEECMKERRRKKMNDERQETVADNVSAKHQFREVTKMIPHEEVDVSKMETTTPTREKSSAVGNAAAMRETLLRCDAMAQMPEIREYTIVKEMRNLIKKALSAPPRNCDVGTMKKQSKRFMKFCHRQKCNECKLYKKDESFYECVLRWSQMPCKEGGKK